MSDLPDIRSLSVDEFEQRRHELKCCNCGMLGDLRSELNVNNNSLRVDCAACGKQHALGRPIWLRQSERPRRKAAPKDTDTVWSENGDYCFICGQNRIVLQSYGFGANAHHCLPYAEHSHEGPLIPVCTSCHRVVSALQANMRLLIGFLQKERRHVA